MARINIGFNTIFKRSSCLNSGSNQKESDYSKIINSIKEQFEDHNGINEHRILNTINAFMEGICNYENANVYYRQPLYFIQEYNDINPRMADVILNNYTSRILPYIEDLSMMEETISRYYINENQKEQIMTAVKEYMTADRILNNHEKISKRFNITTEISKVKSRGLKSVVESCCSMIDTYTIAPYAKFNLCLEEMGYLFDKEGIDYNKRDFVKYVTEYFLLRSPILSSKDLSGYRTVLNENCYIKEDDIENVSYILSDNDSSLSEYHSVTKEIQNFLISQEKTLDIFNNTIKNILLSSKEDIKNNLSKIIMLIWDVYKNQIIDDEDINNAIDNWFNDLSNRMQQEDFTKGDQQNIVITLNTVKNLLVVTSSDNFEFGVSVGNFKDKLDSLIDKMENVSFNTYSKENLEALEFVNNENVDSLPLNEFKIFKFHNLIRASVNLDKYLKYKAKNIYKDGKEKYRKTMGKIKDVLFGESMEQLYASIGEDAKSDICVGQYFIKDICPAEVDKYFVEICKEFNDKLIVEGFDTIRCYYLINDYIAELHLKEATKIELNESDWDIIRTTYNHEFDIYCEMFGYTQACLESLNTMDISIEDSLSSFVLNSNDFTIGHYEVAMECLSLLNIDYDTVSIFTEKFINYYYNTAVLESVITEDEYNKAVPYINNICKEWTREENVPLDIQVEAYNILYNILEVAPEIKKPKVGPNNQKSNVNNKVNIKEKEDDKDPLKGININNLKLYLQGLKQGLKTASQKEKEISRNIDNASRVFVKAMKDALISDRREAIIKGSVIPSFSKCIKIAIGLAGIAKIANPLTALLIAFGGFAASKKLTQKERILLLDEIDTELQVVDKEIAMAESRDQMQRYRALLKYKKDLQRQYQRIRYNIRIGKDVLPGSTVGLKNFDNN